MRVIVVGAGIVGCCLADSLVSRGHQVTLIEAHEVAGGTTATTYAWINSHKKHPDSYHAINRLGMRQWRFDLARRYPDLVAFNGHVEIAVDDEHRTSLSRRLQRLRSLDYEASRVSPQEARRVTTVAVPDDALVGSFPGEGHSYPARLAANLIDELTDEPGFTLLRRRVTAISPSEASVTLASGEEVAGDAVVLCTGTATTALAATAGARIPLLPAEVGGAAFGYLGYARVRQHGITGLVTTDTMNLRPDGPDDLILQALDLDADADPQSTVSVQVHQQFELRLRQLLPQHETTMRDVRVGHRVIPADGLTVAGPVPTRRASKPHLWTIVTHSAVVLAPWLAEVVSDEIGGASPHRLLAEFRPSRFDDPHSNAQTYTAPRRPGDQ